MLRKKLALLVAATMMLASMLAFASVASAVTYSSATATATASATSSASASASAAGAAQYQYASASALPGWCRLTRYVAGDRPSDTTGWRWSVVCCQAARPQLTDTAFLSRGETTSPL